MLHRLIFTYRIFNSFGKYMVHTRFSISIDRTIIKNIIFAITTIINSFLQKIHFLPFLNSSFFSFLSSFCYFFIHIFPSFFKKRMVPKESTSDGTILYLSYFLNANDVITYYYFSVIQFVGDIY